MSVEKGEVVGDRDLPSELGRLQGWLRVSTVPIRRSAFLRAAAG